MNDVEKRILEIIKAKPGQKASDIAAQLGLEKQLVNSALYGGIKGKVKQDKSYRWYPNDVVVGGAADHIPRELDTPLARLCRYYLDCLSHDDLGGVSQYAASRYGTPKYVELDALPMFDAEAKSPFESAAARQLLGSIRRDRNRQIIFLGYPVRLKLIKSRRGWEGFMVEPILLFPFQNADSVHATPTLANDLPQINFEALQSLSNVGHVGLMEEAIQLAEELGLGNTGADQPDIDELLARLHDIRPDWDWQEEIVPQSMSKGAPLSALNQRGIFNRAILIAAERSPYTKGLESELGKLQSVEAGRYQDTALGAWLNEQSIESPPADESPLIEVLPLNSEQRQAVRQALSNPLTVITGPPGTGKSQVVTSILVNAAWQGKTVLFASKNNKAVDVVETRVNALGPRPILLRLGTSEYQGHLAAYLLSLLAATTTPDDRERYSEHEAIHAQLQERSANIDASIKSLIDLRNDVDTAEQRVERIRKEVGDELFCRFRKLNVDSLKKASLQTRSAIEHARVEKQSLTTKIIWVLVRKGRFAKLTDAGRTFREVARDIGLGTPETIPSASTMAQWVEYGHRLAGRVSEVAETQEYFKKLDALTEAHTLEELNNQRKALTDDLIRNSEALWRLWLRLQPSRLGQPQRKLLGDYSATLQMIVSANAQQQQLGRNVYRHYYELFPQVASILPCWAVTSLSAQGRIPFDANFFDLLVIDEASQCDIASALPLLYRARRIVVIGDPMQLRHISTLSKQQDQQLLDKHSLLNSHMGWSYSTTSLFDLASSLCRSEDIVELRDHHRSHADIIGFSNEVFYDGHLRVATNYSRLRPPRQDGAAVRWVDVQGRSVRAASGGAVNEREAQAVLKEIERLINQGYDGSIGVVSPFRAQANRIRDLVNGNDRLATGLASADFLADTVHKFQGDERDVMIFSPVVSSGISDGALAFLRSNPNLFNVAVTRARAALIVVGDKGAALNCGVDYLARFAAYSEQIGRRDEPSTRMPIADLGAEYPTVSNPEQVSDWERLFYRALYEAGIRPIPQYHVKKYVLDFAILDGERRLNVEIDGERYHRNWDGELCRRDQIRNQRLMELGWDVMRFWVYQVRDDLDNCVVRVQEWLGR
jgi:very-short-patch-repair endonuclease